MIDWFRDLPVEPFCTGSSAPIERCDVIHGHVEGEGAVSYEAGFWDQRFGFEEWGLVTEIPPICRTLN